MTHMTTGNARSATTTGDTDSAFTDLIAKISERAIARGQRVVISTRRGLPFLRLVDVEKYNTTEEETL